MSYGPHATNRSCIISVHYSCIVVHRSCSNEVEMAHPRLIFGAMTVGSSFATVEEVTSLLQVLKNLGIKYIDTAPVYPIQSTGACEPLLGRADVQGKGFTIDTKVDVTGPIKGSLREAAIDASLKKSLRCLGVPKVRKASEPDVSIY